MKSGRFEEAIFEQRTLAELENAPAGAAGKLVGWMIQRTFELTGRAAELSITRVIDEMVADPVVSLLLKAEVLIASDHAAEAEKLLQDALQISRMTNGC